MQLFKKPGHEIITSEIIKYEMTGAHYFIFTEMWE